MRIVVGITGASGAIFGVEFLRRCPAEKHLILTKWGRYVLKEETGLTEHHLAEHVKHSFPDEDLSGPFASGRSSSATKWRAPWRRAPSPTPGRRWPWL